MKHLKISSILIGIVGSAVVTMSSTYVALRLGALPWPTVFAALFSMFLLKPFRASLHDINVAHTAVSAGGLVAGGLVFTIPAVWILGKEISPLWIFLSAAFGAIVGVRLTPSTRNLYVEEFDLPFPMGVAAYETIKAGDEGGRKAKILFSSMGASAIFTYLRDGLGMIPVVYKGFGMFPMAVGIGFMIGILPTMSWLAGGIIQMIFQHSWIRDLGLGMMIGGGIGLALKGWKKRIGFGRDEIWMAIFAFIFFAPMFGILPAIIASVLLVLVVHVAAVVDGTTGIDPMEVFAIVVVLATAALWRGDEVWILASLAAVVAVATGLAGDSLQDMKTGKLLGTDPKAQLIAEAIGAAVGVLVGSALLIAVHSKYGSSAFGSTFPVPQAMAVSKFLGGGSLSAPTIAGVLIGAILQILRLPALTFGIGLYLPLFITLPVALGGVIRILVEKVFRRDVQDWIVASSGLLGGEGVVGIIVGLIKPV